jgi:hypothetical protein
VAPPRGLTLACRAQCRQLVRQRGFENLTVDQLAKELLPSGRAAVPDRRAPLALVLLRAASHTTVRSVKAELLKSIKEALQN